VRPYFGVFKGLKESVPGLRGYLNFYAKAVGWLPAVEPNSHLQLYQL
jgi:hypothetical protein